MGHKVLLNTSKTPIQHPVTGQLIPGGHSYTVPDDDELKAQEKSLKAWEKARAKDESEVAARAQKEERLKAEQEEADRKAKEEAERLEAERLAKEEVERLEAERLAKEEADRLEAERVKAATNNPGAGQ